MCSYWRCSFVPTPLTCLAPGMADSPSRSNRIARSEASAASFVPWTRRASARGENHRFDRLANVATPFMTMPTGHVCQGGWKGLRGGWDRIGGTAMGKKIRYDRLPTERPNPRSRDLDRLSAVGIARLMNRADRAAVASVARAARGIGSAVDVVVQRLSRGGRLLFVGAGTSGRLGVLEAAECPPTFDTPPALVQA